MREVLTQEHAALPLPRNGLGPGERLNPETGEVEYSAAWLDEKREPDTGRLRALERLVDRTTEATLGRRLDPADWPCNLCGHGHAPGEICRRCGCRA